MAITLVQHTQVIRTAVSSATLAYGSNLTAGNFLWLGHTQYSTAAIATPTASSHTFTPDGAEQALAGSPSNRQRAFYEPNCASGACTVTFAPASGTADITACISEWSGLDTAAPLDQFASNTGNSTSPSSGATGTRSQADEVLLGLVSHDGTNRTITETGSASLLEENEGGSTNNPMGASYRIVSATGTDAATWTIGTGAVNWLARVATFKAAGGAAAQDTPELYGRPFGQRGQSQQQQLLSQ